MVKKGNVGNYLGKVRMENSDASKLYTSRSKLRDRVLSLNDT